MEPSMEANTPMGKLPEGLIPKVFIEAGIMKVIAIEAAVVPTGRGKKDKYLLQINIRYNGRPMWISYAGNYYCSPVQTVIGVTLNKLVSANSVYYDYMDYEESQDTHDLREIVEEHCFGTDGIYRDDIESVKNIVERMKGTTLCKQ